MCTVYEFYVLLPAIRNSEIYKFFTLYCTLSCTNFSVLIEMLNIHIAINGSSELKHIRHDFYNMVDWCTKPVIYSPWATK